MDCLFGPLMCINGVALNHHHRPSPSTASPGSGAVAGRRRCTRALLKLCKDAFSMSESTKATINHKSISVAGTSMCHQPFKLPSNSAFADWRTSALNGHQQLPLTIAVSVYSKQTHNLPPTHSPTQTHTSTSHVSLVGQQTTALQTAFIDAI